MCLQTGLGQVYADIPAFITSDGYPSPDGLDQALC